MPASTALDSLNKNYYRLWVSRENQRSGAAEPGRVEQTESTAAAAIRRISSNELLGSKGELIIQHDGREYRLRLTQNGKLILTA